MRERKPWDRRDGAGETSKAFDAFAIYRDLGAVERSLEKVRLELGRPQGYMRPLEAWSSRHRWVERARSWDDHQDVVRQKSFLQASQEMAERHAALGAKALLIVDLKLRSVLQQVAVLRDAGKPIEIDGISLAALPQLMSVGANLERLARGESTQITELRVKEGLQIPTTLSEKGHKTLVDLLEEEGKLPGADDVDGATEDTKQ